MSQVETRLPNSNAALRQALYNGIVFHLPRTSASERLTAEVLALLHAELGKDGPIREAQFRLSSEEFFHAVGRLRTVLFQQPRFQAAMQAILSEAGFHPLENAYDPTRLRVITHLGHENPKAAPIYYNHRDTWYANPQCQVSWWIPLHNVAEDETFVFYPEYFQRPVPNDSGRFDYDTWIQDQRSLKIGWQDTEAGQKALYPAFFGDLGQPETLKFSCCAGDIMVFAGSHLHQTVKNTTGHTRFSVDFRTAHLDDYKQGIGAPNVDNRSTGSALKDYIHPAAPVAAVGGRNIMPHG